MRIKIVLNNPRIDFFWKNRKLYFLKLIFIVFDFSYQKVSNLLKAKRGDRVKCKYTVYVCKHWRDLLDKNLVVSEIKYDPILDLCQFAFEGDPERNWFYENDFELLTES